MAIKQEHFTVNGVDFVKTYSDSGRYVVGGEPYGEYIEATDSAEFGRQYTEGEPMPDLDDSESLSILLGGAVE